MKDLIAYLKLQASERRDNDEVWAACDSSHYHYHITYGRLRQLVSLLETVLKVE